jgi:hypothetical protein
MLMCGIGCHLMFVLGLRAGGQAMTLNCFNLLAKSISTITYFDRRNSSSYHRGGDGQQGIPALALRLV